MPDQEPGFIAMKSKVDGWLVPKVTHAVTSPPLPLAAVPDPLPDGKTAADYDNGGPPDLANYAPVRAIRAKAVREYGGINSSGGPQVSGRADQSDFYVEQNTNGTSPKLYEHCCNAKQLEWVHIACLKDRTNLMLHIVMKDVSITGYEFEGARTFADVFETDAGKDLNISKKFRKLQSGEVTGVIRIDKFTLLYTSITFKYVTGNFIGGWDTGTDDAFNAFA